MGSRAWVGFVIAIVVVGVVSFYAGTHAVRPTTLTKTVTLTKSTTVTKSSSPSYKTRTVTVTSTRTLWYTYTTTSYVTVTTPRGPYVILIDGHWQDHRPLLGSPKLILTGYLVNVGGQTAYNVVLHVTFYQGNIVTKKDIIIGTIGPYGWRKLYEEIGYSGSPITNVTIKITWE